MAFSIHRAQYFYVSVKDKPGEAYKLLARIAEFGVNLLAFTGVPIGPSHTQLTVFPEDPAPKWKQGGQMPSGRMRKWFFSCF